MALFICLERNLATSCLRPPLRSLWLCGENTRAFTTEPQRTRRGTEGGNGTSGASVVIPPDVPPGTSQGAPQGDPRTPRRLSAQERGRGGHLCGEGAQSPQPRQLVR